jgi:hypothetical protein
MAAKETLNTRVTRLEDLTRVLVDSQIRTDARLVELREESNQREKRMDERIDKLVIAIGELVSRMPARTLET